MKRTVGKIIWLALVISTSKGERDLHRDHQSLTCPKLVMSLIKETVSEVSNRNPIRNMISPKSATLMIETYPHYVEIVEVICLQLIGWILFLLFSSEL